MIKRNTFVQILISGLLVLLLWLLYTTVKPIPFLFATGLGLSLLFFIDLSQYRKKPTCTQDRLTHRATINAVLIFVLLFTLSLLTLKDYQLPTGKTPYFNNSDHHALQNYAVAFKTDIDLYYRKSDANRGLFSCDTGSFTISMTEGQNPVFHLSAFYTPVFSKTSKKLINPLFTECITAGTILTDGSNSLRWAGISSRIDEDAPVFNMTLVFRSNDPDLLGSFYNSDSPFADTLTIEKLTIRRGIDLKEILLKSQLPSLPEKREMVFRWLNHFSGIYLLKTDSNSAAEPKLSLFPGYDFFNAGSVYQNAQLLEPNTLQHIIIDTLEAYYTGLGNTEESFQVRSQTEAEKKLTQDDCHIIEFKDFGKIPINALPEGTAQTGTTEIRFIKNNYGQLGVNEIRQGFLFKENTKNNDLTNIDALFEYCVDHSGTPLNWKIINLGAAHQTSKSQDLFSLKSENEALQWLFRVNDLSKNKFSFRHNVIYLFLLTLIILSLATLAPGKKVIFIETPLLITVYLLMVFRLLLLWRTATFPPFDDITTKEFNDFRDFDINIIKGIPFSWLITCILLLALLICRRYNNLWVRISNIVKNRLFLIKEAIFDTLAKGHFPSFVIRSFRFYVSNPWINHLMVLVICSGILLFFRKKEEWEWITRILSILVPVISYMYFAFGIIKINRIYSYPAPVTRSKMIQYIFSFLSKWINSPLFFLSFFTLFFLGIWDTGFAVLFLFFLIVKSILLNLSRPFKKVSLTDPDRSWIYGLIALITLSYLLIDKTIIAAALNHKTLLITAALVLLQLTSLILIRPVKIYKTIRLLPVVLLVIFWIPGVKNYIESHIDNKIRHVVYRTSILFQPVEKMLFGYEYNSGKERKIIETAQNQWFINSYLDKKKMGFIQAKNINFRPHFSKGVDYKTQTRDVVLPRFVISEFGGLTMSFLLLSFVIPILIYFLAYRMTENGRYDASSYTGSLALIMIGVSALFVWLCSTNRFVFFGQDFPFLSLTSRISTLLPVMLIATLLILSPVQRLKPGSSNHPNWFGALFLLLLFSLPILITGKSNLLPPGTFKVKFENMETRISAINRVFLQIQETERDPRVVLTEKTLRDNPDRFINAMHGLYDKLYSDKRFRQLYDSCTTYEKSILDKLHANPGAGFRLGNPVHIKFEDGQFFMIFNQYFQLELPAYDIKEVWKGDIAQQSIREETHSNTPRRQEFKHQQAELITIPAAYLPKGYGKRGILNHTTTTDKKYLQSYTYNTESKQLRYTNQLSFAEIVDSSDIIFIKDPSGNYVEHCTINEYERPYFAYGFRINGRQRQVYPMGKSLFWISHFSQTVKTHFENTLEFEKSTQLTLDYKLTDSVNRFLQRSLPSLRRQLPEMSFSVVAADGEGRLRLMADFDMRRELIDPNDNRAISKKRKEEYFIVNKEMVRRQWGNINLLRLNQGPGSSIKPLAAAAIASQLNLGWERLQYQPYSGFSADSKGNIIIDKYAGLRIKSDPWEVANYHNTFSDFKKYIQVSNNLYHSLITFLGSYEKVQFKDANEYNFKKLLTQRADSLNNFPRIGIAGDNGIYYLPGTMYWPGTTKTKAENAAKQTYFGNVNSLIAVGFNSNFGLMVEPTNKSAITSQKTNFTSVLPDTATENGTWAFPEESYFLQSERSADKLNENFIMGLKNPTLGGAPYQVSPFKMLEMYGRLVSFNNQYKVKIDIPQFDTVQKWSVDIHTWGSADRFKDFLDRNIIEGMADVLSKPGTAQYLNNNSNRYKGFYLYAKTGTIDGKTKEDNSKRLALIISKEPLNHNVDHNMKFFVVFFSVGNAYREMANDRSWFWEYYRRVLDEITNSESFKLYMK